RGGRRPGGRVPDGLLADDAGAGAAPGGGPGRLVVPGRGGGGGGPAGAGAGLRADVVPTDGYLARKRHVLDAYARQMTNLTGEAEWWTLDDPFLEHFLRPYEVHLAVRRS